MKTTVALFLVLCLLAVQAIPSGEGETSAGAGTGADSGNAGGSDTGAGSGSNGGAGTGDESGSDGEAGAEAGSGSEGGSGDVYSKRLYNVYDRNDLRQAFFAARGRLVMIYFMTNTCNPCQIMEPQLNKLANDYAGSIIILKVNLDRALDELVNEYSIEGTPTFVFVKNYKKLEVFRGAQYEMLRAIVLKLK